MREELAARHRLRGEFTAKFERWGSRGGWNGYRKTTALFLDVRDKHGDVVADHVWMTVGRQIRELKLQPGDRVKFEARVTEYWKGYRGHDDYLMEHAAPPTKDYRLSHHTAMRRMRDSTEEKAMPLFEQEATL